MFRRRTRSSVLPEQTAIPSRSSSIPIRMPSSRVCRAASIRIIRQNMGRSLAAIFYYRDLSPLTPPKQRKPRFGRICLQGSLRRGKARKRAPFRSGSSSHETVVERRARSTDAASSSAFRPSAPLRMTKSPKCRICRVTSAERLAILAVRLIGSPRRSLRGFSLDNLNSSGSLNSCYHKKEARPTGDHR
jgi:hypothetical protein